MKPNFLLLTASLFIATVTLATAQVGKKVESKPDITASLSPQQLETTFKDTLTEATFVGRWTAIKNGALTAERDEKYHIVGVQKGEGDNWTINARMKYGDQEIVAPIPVQVKWAGDTAVIIVDKLTIPGGGTYDARVLVYKNTYAGTWSGGERGGLLSGIIEKGKE